MEANVPGIVPTVYGYTRPICSGSSSTSQQAEIETYFAQLQQEGFNYGGCFSDPFDSSRLPLGERKAFVELDRHLKPGAQVVIANTSTVWNRPKDFTRIAGQWISSGGLSFICLMWE